MREIVETFPICIQPALVVIFDQVITVFLTLKGMVSSPYYLPMVELRSTPISIPPIVSRLVIRMQDKTTQRVDNEFVS